MVIAQGKSLLWQNDLIISRFFLAKVTFANDMLVEPQRIILPLYHFKLGLMKNFHKHKVPHFNMLSKLFKPTECWGMICC